MTLPDDVVDLFNDPTAVKILATRTADGDLHIIPVGSMRAPNANAIIFANIFMKESKRNLINMMNTRALVSVLCVSTTAKTSAAYQVKCKVKEYQTSGPLYEKFLDELRALSLDLDGVWILKPIKVIDQTPGPHAGQQIV